MVDIAIGKYEDNDGFIDEECIVKYLKDLCYKDNEIKAATALPLKMEVTENGGQWIIKQSTKVVSAEWKFKLGEKFEESMPGGCHGTGREVSSIVTRDENNFICTRTAKKSDEKSTKMVLKFTEDGCLVTMEILGSDGVCMHKYQRL